MNSPQDDSGKEKEDQHPLRDAVALVTYQILDILTDGLITALMKDYMDRRAEVLDPLVSLIKTARGAVKDGKSTQT